MSYRFKERDVWRDLGAANDLKYYASSGSGYLPTYQKYFSDEAYWLDRYNQAMTKRSSLVYAPNGLGRERIRWESGGAQKYNQCDHAKSLVVNKPHGVYYERCTSPTTLYFEDYWRKPSPAYYPYDLSVCQHPEIDYQAVRARAWHNMQPRFEGKISVINFIFELKDFRDIVKYLYKDKNRVVFDYIREIRNRWKTPKNLTPASPTREIAEAQLVNSFALQPLIKDLAEMFNQANIIVREAQSKFAESGSQYQTSHYTEELNRIDTRTKYTNNNYWWASGYLETTKFTATLKYKYDYTMRNTVDAWIKYWGLCLSFEAFWNMIPFSFLVDYFVQVGKSIHAMEHDPNVHLNDWIYGESLKTQIIYGISTTGDPRHRVLILDGKVYLKERGDRIGDRAISAIVGSKYNRGLRYPYYGPATPRIKWPSTKQALNIAALLRCLL